MFKYCSKVFGCFKRKNKVIPIQNTPEACSAAQNEGGVGNLPMRHERNHSSPTPKRRQTRLEQGQQSLSECHPVIQRALSEMALGDPVDIVSHNTTPKSLTRFFQETLNKKILEKVSAYRSANDFDKNEESNLSDSQVSVTGVHFSNDGTPNSENEEQERITHNNSPIPY